METVNKIIISKGFVRQILQLAEPNILNLKDKTRKLPKGCKWVTVRGGAKVCLVPRFSGPKEGVGTVAEILAALPDPLTKNITVVTVRRTPPLEMVPMFIGVLAAAGAAVFGVATFLLGAPFVAKTFFATRKIFRGGTKAVKAERAAQGRKAFFGTTPTDKRPRSAPLIAAGGIGAKFTRLKRKFSVEGVKLFEAFKQEKLGRETAQGAGLGAIIGGVVGGNIGLAFAMSILGDYDPATKQMRVFPLNNAVRGADGRKKRMQDTLNHEAAHSLYWMGLEGPRGKKISAKTSEEKNLMFKFMDVSVKEKGVSGYANIYLKANIGGDERGLFATENFAEVHRIFRARERGSAGKRAWARLERTRPETVGAFFAFLGFHNAR